MVERNGGGGGCVLVSCVGLAWWSLSASYLHVSGCHHSAAEQCIHHSQLPKWPENPLICHNGPHTHTQHTYTHTHIYIHAHTHTHTQHIHTHIHIHAHTHT